MAWQGNGTRGVGQFPLPTVLQGVPRIAEGHVALPEAQSAQMTREAFPNVYGLHRLGFTDNTLPAKIGRRLRVGFVLAGGLAPGCTEVISGLFYTLKRWNSSSTLLGFRMGFQGLISNDHIEIDQETVRSLLREEGLGRIGSGRAKLDEGKLASCSATCQKEGLAGLVVLGGAHTLTDACALADHMKRKKVGTAVVCASKRADGMTAGAACQGGDYVDVGYGFDSTAKHFSWLVGNLAADVSSAKSSYHFVRLMGDKNSYGVLETALDVHPNVAFIGEEIDERGWTLHDLVDQICDVVCERATMGLNYGIVIMPEGILDSVREVRQLLNEIHDMVDQKEIDARYHEQGESAGPSQYTRHMTREECLRYLSDASRGLALRMPPWFVEQTVTQRTDYNELRMANIQVERLFASMCAIELAKRAQQGRYVGKFSYHTMFYGYEGRCQQPSHFDCCLGNALGAAMKTIIEGGHSGYLVNMTGLSKPVSEWRPVAIPLTALMTKSRRGGPMVRNGRVQLSSYVFKAFEMLRAKWVVDNYRFSVGTLSNVVSTVVQLNDLHRRHDQQELLREQEKLKDLINVVRELALAHNNFVEERLAYDPPVPSVLQGSFVLQELKADQIACVHAPDGEKAKKLQELFPATFGDRKVYKVGNNTSEGAVTAGRPLRVGILLSGGPAPGGHNVIAGLHDFLKAQNAASVCLGLVNGPDGLLRCNAKEITREGLAAFRNQGGFNLIGTSRTKIEKPEQFKKAAQTVATLQLDGLVVCGGDDSNTNAAVLADYFKSNSVPCQVIGVPKTIDADLRSDALEMSFGFDTTTKVYSTLIANIMLDARARKDRWHFVRVMGRAASHIALECSLQTHPNYSCVSEEIARDGKTVLQIVQEIADVIVARAKGGKDYGVVLVPEGLIEVCKDLMGLMSELNEQMARGIPPQRMAGELSEESRTVFGVLPDWLKTQLMSERDPHGNVRVSLIESERLLASLVAQELTRREEYPDGKEFKFWCHFLGYQGRCSVTSNFDCDYCYTLGHLCGCLVAGGATGVICAVRNLCQPAEQWELLGVPIVDMMTIERRKGADKPVIEKKLVDLEGPVFRYFAERREAWKVQDDYPNRSELKVLRGVFDHTPTLTMLLEKGGPALLSRGAAQPSAGCSPKL
eukprot:TRINITY_DN343_c0_g1_i1.p1 TRINITY_DN343_c0_g1~~TRINITY_DN343_c0_g1_i1.p1  ORF type:complete len:1177 (+),score=384.21 TRINITY_DN343_c0_g1_i1:93-3533(+)